MTEAMRNGVVLCVVLALQACASEVDEGTPSDPSFPPLPEGETVEFVEVEGYLGTWYEVASIPQGFQAACTGTTATYGVVDEDTISVTNRCFIDSLDGDEVELEGTADVIAENNAKLEVDFGVGSPAGYWIVDLSMQDEDGQYQWAAVSNESRSSLWILSRAPQMDPSRYDGIVSRLAMRGFDPERLEPTPQPE